MATPNPQSYDQILGKMLSTYLAKIGINDINQGSAVSSFFEAMAQAVYGATGGVFATLRDFSVDRATGEALKRIAAEENIKLDKAQVATGKVTFNDTSFTKISTKVYAGATAPNIGSVVVKVSDASLAAASGAIYIGRGTANIEGPIAYTSKSQVGGYWELNLATPTTKFHNISETVIFAQGGVRNIAAGTVVKAPAAGGAPDILFKTTQAAIILDGENQITNVPVAADQPGSDSNVPKNSIKEIGGTLFTGATVTNDQPFITGKNEETDDEIREKIKKARISRGLGTTVAVKNATLGAQATDENARVTSNEMFSDTDSATLFIDNGEGYEQKTSGVGLEFIVDSALGGETRFQLSTGGQQTSVAKAFLESASDAPYSISPNDRLAILVAGVLNEHIFSEGNFRSNGFATAYEVAASINADPDITYVARTSNNGKRVTVEAKSESSEYLQITTPTAGGDAAAALDFTSNEVQTLRLYKNRQPLSRNGRTATVESANQSDWSSSIVTGETLIISVDGTAAITYTLTNADFVAEGTYPTISKSNSLQSWINVLNSKITGVTASINGNRIVLTSNLGTSARAKLSISLSSTLVSKGVFTASLGLDSVGSMADFTLSRNTAQFKLTNPLEVGDSLTAGTEFSKASVSTAPILGGNVTFANDAYFWFAIDQSEAKIINSGVASDTFITVSKPNVNIIRYTSSVTTAFINVNVGDYVIVWSGELSASNRLEGRVNTVTGTSFDIKVTPNEFAGAIAQVLVLYKEGIVFLRNPKAPQKIKIAAGTYNINTVAADIATDLIGADTSTSNDEVITINSKTNDTYGSILTVTFNDAAKSLNLTEGELGVSIPSHFAFYESDSSDADYPLFVHSSITNDEFADTPNAVIPSFNSAVVLSAQGVSNNEFVSILNPYLTSGVNIKDAQPENEIVQIDSLAGNTINIDSNQFIRRLRVGDRYFAAGTFDFGYNDSLILVLDEDPTNKTFPIPLYRKATTNTTMSVDTNNFRAYDSDSGPSAQFATYFGSDFDFKNYKVLMQSRRVIDPAGATANDAVLFRSAYWGAAGDKFAVGYGYPTSANQSVAHTTIVDSNVSIKITLKSGVAVPNQIDGTTEWNVTVTPNSPVAGVDQVSYTWSGTGTNPAMGTLVPGNYVTVNTNGEFSPANTGTFRVSSATGTSFTVSRPNGVAVTESNISNLTSTTILLYQDSATTANDIVTYVTTFLPDFLTASIIADGGNSGTGVINKSTYESNSFQAGAEYIFLVDGINYLASSNVSASAPNPQFTLKNSLLMASYSTNTINAYTFSGSEEIRFIPTTAKQIDDLISILAVSGVTTLGNIDTSSRNGKLQIATKILGSSGAVQISGGAANLADALIIGQSVVIPNTSLVKSTILRSSAAGFQAGQFVKLTSLNSQKKETGISLATNVTIHPNTIVAGKTVIELANKEDPDRYFGQPRASVRDIGRAFHVEKHGKLVCISWDGITGADPMLSKAVEINADNGNVSVTFDSSLNITKYTVTSGTRNFSEVEVGDTTVIQAMAAPSNNGTFKILGISSDKKTIATSNSKGLSAAPASVLAANLTVSTAIEEGDTVKIGAPFAALNQGSFRVIRKYNNSFYIDNVSATEERVVVSENLRTLGFDATTQFNITVPGNMRFTWNEVGTQPTLENAKLGDTLIVGTAFASANQGSFMVTKSNKPMFETFTFICPQGSDIAGGERIQFDLPNAGTGYYGWFNLSFGSVDPAPIGRTGVEFDYVGTETSSAIATIVQTQLNALSGVSATVSGNIVTVIMDNYGPAVDAENIDVGGVAAVKVIQQGSLAFIECANAKATVQSNIAVTGVGGNVLKSHNPSMVFSPYENTVAGDSIVISGSVLTANNAGTYVIVEVLDQERVVINNILAIQNNVNIGTSFEQVYVSEELPYVGYKRISNLFVDPSNFNFYTVIFDTTSQVSKINDVGVATMSALGKLGFSELNRKGLDSYRFHTGLIAQVNKIVYGDPRDNTTYPGVAAAGAEIFIEPPLFRRIVISINVRVKTGIPFNRVVEQVRNNIASLVNSTAIGQPIAISNIISTTNSIPGVTAVSISSPNYSPTSDVIAVAANEKPLIIDIVNDILVAKVG